MKELSIEEKAKAYDKAIETFDVILNLDNVKESGTIFVDDIRKIFPELAESENERIRKELIHLVNKSHEQGGYALHKDEAEEMIAYLEKQGEQEVWSEEDKNMLKWVIGYLENKMLNTPIGEERTACKNAIDWLEEKLKGEQKPVEWTMDNIEELTEFESAMMHIGGSFFGEHQGLDPNDTNAIKEQANILLEFVPKQEWSEEDETKIKSIIALLKNPAVCTMDGNKGIIDASIKYLKSLKNRVQPQTKQEWSEEDEEHIKSLLERLEGMCKKGATFIRTGFAVSEDEDWLKHLKDRVLQPKQEWSEEDNRMCKAIINNIKAICKEGYFVGNIDSGELINWFKSLRHRLQWKPSDEQMDALLVKIPIENSCNKVDNILKSLYSDLKKLK